MSTERQIHASRANGSKSRGPITPEGKRASSRNATTHGMLSGTVVLECESTERFLKLVTVLLDEFQPQTPFEESLIQNMAVARWRQMRIWGLEKAGMDYEMRRQAEMSNSTEDSATRASIVFRTLSDDSRSLELIGRYDSRYERQYYRAHRRFVETRDRRTPPPAQTPQPAPDGSPLRGPRPMPAIPTPPVVPQSVPQSEPENVFLPNEPNPSVPEKAVLAKRTRQVTANKAARRKGYGLKIRRSRMSYPRSSAFIGGQMAFSRARAARRQVA